MTKAGAAPDEEPLLEPVFCASCTPYPVVVTVATVPEVLTVVV